MRDEAGAGAGAGAGGGDVAEADVAGELGTELAAVGGCGSARAAPPANANAIPRREGNATWR
jgi:hypothetical protein